MTSNPSQDPDRRSATDTFTIAGPYLTILASDADEFRGPPVDRTDTENGKAYSSTLQDLSSKTSKHWRRKLGSDLAHKFLLRARGRTNVLADTRQRPSEKIDYILTDFPRGYHLYSRNVGSRMGTDEIRRDSYLYGAGRTFRSPNEVLWHFAWLMRGQNKFLCKCVYCTPLKAYKRKQRILNKQLKENCKELIDDRVRRNYEKAFGRRAVSTRPSTPIDNFNDFFVLRRPSLSEQ